MDDIDVEPVDRIDEADDVDRTRAVDESETDGSLPIGVNAPEYVLYGGKGGVGKTTMAAATALASAAGGVRTLVVSTDPAHSLSDTFETDVPPEPTRIREDMPLYAAEIDPDDAMTDGMFGGEGNSLGGLGGMLGDDIDGTGAGTDSLLGGPMPGADEAAALRQLLEYLDDPRFDRVVVDTAPTGHTLRLLQLPEIMDSMLGRVLKMRQQFAGMFDGVKGMFGGGSDDTEDPSADLEALQSQIERLRTVLQDPDRTDFRVVLIPETMSVVESERLVARLDEFDIPVRTVVVNRVMEALSDVSGVNPEWVVEPDPEHCEFCARRWDVQQQALRQATGLFRGRDVKRVPLLADAVHGEAALRVVASCLE